MSTVEEIKVAIQALPRAEYIHLRQWLIEKDWEKWDKQIEENSMPGKLNFLIKEALDDKMKGKLKEL